MDKHVDESWKDSAQKEKAKAQQDSQEPLQFESNFNTLISGIAMEGLIFLGEIPSPITKKKEESLGQAKYAIDTLTLLKEKTKGNLTAEEANSLDNILYELRTKFVAKSSK
ncbi:MAG: DUF1844 domain-containing protein [Candidatus Omnitrophota bacterium]